ncbi:hypothetical protein FI667_g6726, partial [Globisporangium splendens]
MTTKRAASPLPSVASPTQETRQQENSVLLFLTLEIQPAANPRNQQTANSAPTRLSLLCNTSQPASTRQPRQVCKPALIDNRVYRQTTAFTLVCRQVLFAANMPNTGKSHWLHPHAYTLRDKSQRPRPVIAVTHNSATSNAYMTMPSSYMAHGSSAPYASADTHAGHQHRQHGYSAADSNTSDESAFLRSAQHQQQLHQMHEKLPSAAWRDEIGHCARAMEQRLPLVRGVKRPAPTGSSSSSPSPSHRHRSSYSSGRTPPAYESESSSDFPSHSQNQQQAPLCAPVSLPTLSCLLQRTSAAPVTLGTSQTAAAPLYKRQRMFAAPPLRATNDDLIGADTERLRRILDEEVAFYNQRSSRVQNQDQGHQQFQLDAASRAQECVVHVSNTLRRNEDDHEARRPSGYQSSSSRPFLRGSESFDMEHKRLSESSLTSSCSPGSSDAASPPAYPTKKPMPPRSPKYSTSQQQQMPSMQQQRDSRHHRESRMLSRRYEEEQDRSRRVLPRSTANPCTIDRLDHDEEDNQDDEDNKEDHDARGDSYRNHMPSTPPPSSTSSFRYPMDRHHDAAVRLVEERSPSKHESVTKLLLKSKEFLQAKSLVRNRNNEIDWVATFLNVGFESSSIYSLMCPLRKGRWKVEEEKYTMELLKLIESGTIRLRHGQSIRSFVAKKLHSDDMRVLKKLSNCKMFHFARLITPQMADEDEIDESVAGAVQSLERLRKLHSEFLRSVQLEALVAVRKYLSDSSIRELLNG